MEQKLYIDQAGCVGCELCVNISAVFVLNDCDKAEIREGRESKDTEIQDAIDNCPARCIYWQRL